MSLKKLILAGSIGLAFVASPASAITDTVLGITWDPNAPVDFAASGTLWEQPPSTTLGSTVTGYGVFNLMNGADIATYGGGTHELTYVYTLTLTDIFLFHSAYFFTYSGSIDVYSTLTSVYSPTNATPAQLATQTLANATGTPATLFLHTILTSDGLSGVGYNFGNPASVNGTGTGWLSVIGGAAQAYFDTNTMMSANNSVADLTFSSSFNAAQGSAGTNYPVGYPIIGTSTVTGNSISKSIPEPAAIALLSMGLLGFGLRRLKPSLIGTTNQ